MYDTSVIVWREDETREYFYFLDSMRGLMDVALYDALMPIFNELDIEVVNCKGIYNHRYMRRLDGTTIYGINPGSGQSEPKVSSHAWARGIDIISLIDRDGVRYSGSQLAQIFRREGGFTVVDEGHVHVNVPYPAFKFPNNS